MERPGPETLAEEAMYAIADEIADCGPRRQSVAAVALNALDKAGFDVVRKLPRVDVPIEPGWYWAQWTGEPEYPSPTWTIAWVAPTDLKLSADALAEKLQGYTDWRGPLTPPGDE